jgi:hypothetical protein
MSAWSCFYSTELIRTNNWRFVSEREIISEDVYSLLGLYASVKRVSVIEKRFYNYCENDTSLTHSYREDRFERNNVFYIETVNRAKKYGFNEEIISCVSYPYMANIIALLKQIVFSDLSVSGKIAKVNNIIGNEVFQEALRRIDLNIEKKSRYILFWQMKRKNAFVVTMLIRANGVERNAR